MEPVTTGLETIGTLFTQFATWFGSMGSTLIAQPIFLLSTGIFVVGAVIGLVFRAIRN